MCIGLSFETPAACTFEGPGLQNTTKNSTRRPSEKERKRTKMRAEREKKARNFGLPTLRGSTFSEFGAATFGPHPSGPRLQRGGFKGRDFKGGGTSKGVGFKGGLSEAPPSLNPPQAPPSRRVLDPPEHPEHLDHKP